VFFVLFFFFQAEDGIRDFHVTGVQTCALPILLRGIEFRSMCEHHLLPFFGTAHVAYLPGARFAGLGALARAVEIAAARPQLQERSEERRVGRACTSRLEVAQVLKQWEE